MIDKTAIYNETKQLLADWYPGAGIGARGDCLYWTHAAISILHRRHRQKRVILQAGTMLWPCAADTGANITHFGYEWSPHCPHSFARAAAGQLPELHIWAALPEDGELIDFSTGHFKKLAAEAAIDWDLEDPPQFLFGIPPRGARYQPVRDAILFVHQFMLRDYLQGHDLEQLSKDLYQLAKQNLCAK